MKKIVLYIAASIDGYIATKDHSVGWLEQLENPEGSDYGYQDFVNGVDTLLMGRKTYDIIRGFDIPWPYEGQKTYVITRQEHLRTDTPNTEVLSGSLATVLPALKASSGEKNIWLVGGGATMVSLLRHQAIDEIMLFTAPVLLGSGIPLFPESDLQYKLTLEEHKTYASGMCYTRYAVNY
ncbi:dihydrofolate reductase family protein [Robertkochia sediminum]|uniref:dihydrofolate reductase family protein n=1 Tax=Robertkochia sediminum TaxID=2785326 RepID=UPI0019317E36|nr:dihydrofolate reductase family protein [Robertkochia sediminum]MBL7473219.1 dihydrofolate reductase [Robertkochia sediminum]